MLARIVVVVVVINIYMLHKNEVSCFWILLLRCFLYLFLFLFPFHVAIGVLCAAKRDLYFIINSCILALKCCLLHMARVVVVVVVVFD